MKVSENMNIIFKTLSSVLMILFVVLAMMLVGVRIFGLQVYTVLSGSMEPTYHVGSVIYVKNLDPADLCVGDPLTFGFGPDATATHRIVGIFPDEQNPDALCFQTKGDANNSVDESLVSHDEVIGKPIFTVPYLGYLASFIQTKAGKCICIAAAILVLVMLLLAELTKPCDDSPKRIKMVWKKKA